MGAARSVADRLWEKVNIGEPDDCWEFTGCRRNGYGRIGLNGKLVTTHRLAYELKYGPIPEGMYACHRCNNPSCCNPDHIYAGTPTENAKDRDVAGHLRISHVSGERHGNCRYPDAVIKEIRELWERGGISMREISRRYGMSREHVGNVVRGKKRVVA